MDNGRRNLLKSLPLMGAPPAPSRSAHTLEERLLQALEKIETVNTHEHIIPEAERVAQRVDFFTLAGHYAINDLISAGLPANDLKLINNPDAPVADRWRVFEPFWKVARFTGYSQALRL